jgi:hypothetical protein
MLGLNISSTFNSAVTIYILIPFILIPMLIFSGVMVKFDKLNPTIIVHNSVPMIGEVMVTRWAYEAMAVNQFTTNNYEKHFYDYDKKKSIADFKKNFWIPRLKTKNDDCLRNLNNPENAEVLKNDLLLLKNELERGNLPFKEISDIFSVEMIDELEVGSYTEELGKSLKLYLESLNTYYIRNYNNIYKKKNLLVSHMNSTKEKKELFLAVKDAYQNEALSDLVTNKTEIDKILELPDELVQQSDPIYMDPAGDGNIRAHFFAPRKRFFGKLYNTFWVNIIVIWTMSLMLAVTLYFEIFRRVLERIGDMVDKIIKLFSKKAIQH